MDILIWFSVAIWSVLLITWIINTVLVGKLGRMNLSEPEKWPSVSIIVPARNEERSIEMAVSSYCEQDYPDFEVIVVNDCSTDATGNILDKLSQKYKHLKVIDGREPPEGWLGKPNALEIGKLKAKGKWLLFVDADVHYSPDLLKKAVCYAEKEKAGMLFLLPRFITKGIIEPAVLSTLALVAFGVAPLFLVPRTKWKFLACGGGVFNMVRRDVIENIKAFDCIKDAVIDDVGLGYAVKKAGYKLAVARAIDMITIRMYYGAKETLKGFTKNIYPQARKFPFLIFLPFIIGFIFCFMPYIALFHGFMNSQIYINAVVALTLMHIVYAMLVLTFRQPWFIVFVCPLSELLWWWMLIKSVWMFKRKGLVWRGRNYKVP